MAERFVSMGFTSKQLDCKDLVLVQRKYMLVMKRILLNGAIRQSDQIDETLSNAEHGSRVLSIVASPDKEMVASCGADETLRIWHCFRVDRSKKRVEASRNNSTVLAYSQPIR